MNFSVKSLADFRLSIVGHAMWGHNSPSCNMFQCYIAAKISFLAAHTLTVLLNVYVQDTDQSSGWLKNVSFEFGIYSVTDCVTD